MEGLYALVKAVSWWLGLLSLIAGIVTKLVMPTGLQRFGITTAHSLVFLAAVLFLCSLATRSMQSGQAER
jgi:hypothetical protein